MDAVDRMQQAWARERPDLDASPTAIIGRLHRLAAHLTTELVAVYREYGLSEGEFDVLATLRRAGAPFEHAPGELAEHTMVTTGAMTKRIDRLESAGLVARRVSDTDARARTVALTDKGHELIDRAFEHHLANEQRLLASLDPDEQRAIRMLLTKWLGDFE